LEHYNLTTENTPTVEGAPAAADTPIEGAAEGAQPEVQAPVLEVDQFGNHLVPVKIDGEVLTVPLAEAINGYQRQQDYTRKAQEVAKVRDLAERAEAIERAFQQDPAETIRILSESYGVDLNAILDGSAEQVELDPVEARLAAIEQTFQAQQLEQRKAQLNSELDRVTAAFGVDPEAVVKTALDMGTDNLERVAKIVAYDKVMAQQAAQAPSEPVDPNKVDAKRTAPVHGGGTNPGAATSPPVINSFRDAAAAAMQQLGIA
jgi:hypothetical protein